MMPPSFTTANTVPPACCPTCACEYGRCVYTYTMSVAKADGARSAVSAGSAACVDNASLAAITWGWSKVSEDETYCYYEFKQEGPCCTEEGDPCVAPEFSGPPLPTPAPDCTIGGGESTCISCGAACYSDASTATVTLPDIARPAIPDAATKWNAALAEILSLTWDTVSNTGWRSPWSTPFEVTGDPAAPRKWRIASFVACADLSVTVRWQISTDGGATWPVEDGGFSTTGTATGDFCGKTWPTYSTHYFGDITGTGDTTVAIAGNTCCKNEAGDCVTGTANCADGTCNPFP